MKQKELFLYWNTVYVLHFLSKSENYLVKIVLKWMLQRSSWIFFHIIFHLQMRTTLSWRIGPK